MAVTFCYHRPIYTTRNEPLGRRSGVHSSVSLSSSTLTERLSNAGQRECETWVRTCRPCLPEVTVWSVGS